MLTSSAMTMSREDGDFTRAFVAWRDLMPSTAVLALIILLVSAPAFAEDFVVFHANFTGDTVGIGPALDPVGDPDGDSIWYYSLTEPSSAIVHSSFWSMPNKALVVSRISGSEVQVYYSFDPDHIDCESYTVSFDAMAGNPLEYAYFTFREEGLRHFMTMGFADDPRLDISGQGPITLANSGATTSVRWYEAQALSFRFEIDLVTGVYSMFIDDVAVPEAQDHPFTVGNQDGTFAHMGMHFGGLMDAVLAVDNLEVVAHCGVDVGAEGPSWGSIKAQWR